MLKEIKRRFVCFFSLQNRQVTKELVLANIKLSDYHSILGVLCSLIGPVSVLAVMYFVFFSSLGKGIPAYPLYLLTGIVLVNFFTVSSVALADTFVKNRDIVNNTLVLRETLLFVEMSPHLLKFIIELIICCVISAALGLFYWGNIICLVPVLLGIILLVAGTGFILSILRCFTYDTRHIWGMLSRLLYFATPIFYTLDGVSERIRSLLEFCNPLIPILGALRWAVIETPFSRFNCWCAFFIGMVFFIAGYIFFIVFEDKAMEKV